jgi:hypothetical protein
MLGVILESSVMRNALDVPTISAMARGNVKGFVAGHRSEPDLEL